MDQHLCATSGFADTVAGLQFSDLGISRRDFAPEQTDTGFRYECQYETLRNDSLFRSKALALFTPSSLFCLAKKVRQ